MNPQFKKGSIELCVLSELTRRDMYGYEVVQSISDFIEVTESTIYPILRRLTKEGYFTTYTRSSKEGPDRKYYKITEEGRERLKQSLKQWVNYIDNVNKIIGRGVINE